MDIHYSRAIIGALSLLLPAQRKIEPIDQADEGMIAGELVMSLGLYVVLTIVGVGLPIGVYVGLRLLVVAS